MGLIGPSVLGILPDLGKMFERNLEMYDLK